jgi:predicted AAA+ superfamily ATPase
MDTLFNKQIQKLRHTPTKFVRSISYKINWEARLIGIKGARGVGKSTLLLQHIKLNFKKQAQKVLYISLDNIWFANNALYQLADDFVKKGGTHLFIDEVHRYPNWSQEIKNIYDDFYTLHIVFTGSSLLEILNARADLSRRAISYTMQGLSLREYISMETGIKLESYSLDEILENHLEISQKIIQKIKPFKYIDNYLKYGYYPFYKEQTDLYASRLNEVINMTLEIELPQLRKVDISYIYKLKQLLVIISESVPFIPNISKLSAKIGINRATLLSYFHYLEESSLTINLFKKGSGISKLQKPNKTYLENTNLMFALSPNAINKGNLRETFFINQLQQEQIYYSEKSDFYVNNKYTFEVGGKNKTNKQIVTLNNAFIVADDIAHGFQNKIPLWLFGFLY